MGLTLDVVTTNTLKILLEKRTQWDSPLSIH